MESNKYVSYDNLTSYDGKIKNYLGTTISDKKEKDLIVTYQDSSTFYATHSSEEIFEAVNNGRTVKFKKDAELLDILESTTDWATFYIFYVNQSNKIQQKIVVISGDSVALEQDDTYDYATLTQLNNKADKTTLNNYYTKTESDNINDILNESINTKANQEDVLIKTEQTLTDEELTQVRTNLKFIGKNLYGNQYTIDGETYTASDSAEIFGDYDTNIAVGQWSIAEGSGTKAIGRATHAEGAFGQAIADGSHVEGYGTKATGYWSHAEGEYTIVSSYASHAEGSYTKMPDGSTRYSTAAGYASHTEGGGCHTTGVASHAEGIGTTANGRCAHVEGTYTIASGKAQHVEGLANIEDASDTYIHIAGNGTSPTDRSNAHTLDWDGNAEFMGDVVAHGCSSEETPISLIDINNRTNSLEISMGEIGEITSEDIQSLFN